MTWAPPSPRGSFHLDFKLIEIKVEISFSDVPGNGHQSGTLLLEVAGAREGWRSAGGAGGGRSSAGLGRAGGLPGRPASAGGSSEVYFWSVFLARSFLLLLVRKHRESCSLSCLALSCYKSTLPITSATSDGCLL